MRILNGPASVRGRTKQRQSLRSVFEKLLQPHPSILEPERRRRIFLLSSLLFTLILVGIAGLLLSVAMHNGTVNYIIVSTGIAFLIAALLINRTKIYRITPLLITSLIGVVVFLQTIVEGNPYDLFFLILGVLVSSLYPSPWITVETTGLYTGIILFVSLVYPTFAMEDFMASLFLTIITGAIATVAAAIQSRDFKHIQTQSNELSSQINELAQNRKALLQNQAMLKLQIERMPVGCIVLDPDLKITAWNPAAEKIFGFSAHEAIGQQFNFYSPQNTKEKLADRVRQFIENDLTATTVYENMTKDGRTITCEWMDTPLKNADGEIIGLLSMVQDITQRKKAEEALNASEERYRNLFNKTPIALYRTSISGQILECNDAFVALFGYPDRQSMLNMNVDQLKDDDQDHVKELAALGYSDKHHGIPLRIFRYDQTPIWVEDNYRVVRDSKGNPLYHEGSLEDITSRVLSQQQIQRNQARLQAMAKISQLFAGASRNYEEILDICTQQGAQLIGDACAMTLISDTDYRLHLASLYHPNEEAAEFLKKTIYSIYQEKGNWLPESVAQSEEALRIDSLSQGEIRQAIKPELWSLLEKYSMHSVLIVPMRSQDRLIGTLGVSRDRPGNPYNDDDQALLQEIAERTAQAITNARLFEKVQHSFDKLQALRQIDIAISSSLDLRVSLGTIIDQALTQTGVDAAGVLVLDPQTHILEYVTGKGFRTNILQHIHLRLGEGYAGRAALDRKTVQIRDLRGRTTDFLRNPGFRDEDFVSYFAVPLVAKGQVKGVIEIYTRSLFQPDLEWIDFIEALAGQGAIAIDNANLFSELQRSNQELAQSYDATIEGWSHALDLRDKETEGHTLRVTQMTLRLAQMLGVNQSDWEHVRRGALLHDVGKMAIPDNILLKPGPLSEKEWAVMRKHPQYAYEMIASIPYLRKALDIPLYHHERWDGSGYPHRLSGDQIPLPARIFAVVDVWDALSYDRPYRRAWSDEKVRNYLENQSGKHFDPLIVKSFLRILDEVKIEILG